MAWLAFFMVLNYVQKYQREFRNCLETTTLVSMRNAFFRVIDDQPLDVLYSSMRYAVRGGDSLVEKPNIILIVNESWGKQGFLGADNELSKLKGLLDETRGRNFTFKYAYSNSTATDISIPSLLTGVGSEEGATKLHTMPFIWEWAKSIGYQTIFTTSQDFGFANFSDFMFSFDPPDSVKDATVMDLSLINDLGVDDFFAVDHFIQAIEASEKPFFGVYLSNALHPPYQNRSDGVKDELLAGKKTRYRKALTVLDLSMGKIFDYLRKKDILEDTLFIFTSDHGEGAVNPHQVHRIYSFYEEYTNIPFIFIAPQKWQTTRRDWLKTLELNKDRLIANIDIVPTVGNLLGLKESNPNIYNRFLGYSLLQKVPEDRVVISLSTNDIRRSEREGFGVYKGAYRIVHNNRFGIKLFNIVEDPLQNKDLWPTAGEKVKKAFLGIIGDNEFLSRMAKED